MLKDPIHSPVCYGHRFCFCCSLLFGFCFVRIDCKVLENCNEKIIPTTSHCLSAIDVVLVSGMKNTPQKISPPLRGAHYRYHFAFTVNRTCMTWILGNVFNFTTVELKESVFKKCIISQIFIYSQK